MPIIQATVEASREVARNVRTISIRSEELAPQIRPGQFLNVKPDWSYDPLLRRAYSVHRVIGSEIELIYNVHGKGSRIFAEKRPGDLLDVMGPLGVPFHMEGEYQQAILVSGGLGIAPMPILGDALAAMGKDVLNVHGARSGDMIVDDGRLINPVYATDDGSLGLRGNVIDAIRDLVDRDQIDSAVKFYACGPNRMLDALATYCTSQGFALEVSLECQMACGIGICQGCPVEMTNWERRYSLVCTHGPNYDINDINIESLPVEHG